MPDNDRCREIAAQQRGYFNRLADVFDVPQPAAVLDRLRQIVAAAEIRPGEAVLDAGAGTGVLIPLIETSRPSSLIACDLSEQMLARLHKNHPGVMVLQADIVQLSLRDACVDVIFMNAMYGNIADKRAACAHAARVLRRGGRLVISHPEGKSFVEQLRATSGLFLEPLPAKEEFQFLAGPLGLETITYRDEPKLYLLVARKT